MSAKIKWNKQRSIEYFITELQKNADIESRNPESYLICIDQLEAWEDFVNSFCKYFNIINLCSLKTINIKLSQIFHNFDCEYIKSNLSKISKELIDLGNELEKEFNNENEFFFETILLNIDKNYTFENIEICLKDKACEDTSKIEQKVNDILPSYSPKSINDSSSQYNDLQKEINEIQKNVVIYVKEQGDQHISLKNALETARKFMDEICFFAHVFQRPQTLPSLKIDKKNSANYIQFNYINEKIRTGSLRKYNILPTYFSLDTNIKPQYKLSWALENYKFPIFQKAKNNDLMNRISIAISWAAKAKRHDDEHIKFLFCCIGLESLFTKESDERISESLASKCAQVLENDTAQKIKLKKKIKDLYKKRSGLAHGRQPQILEQDLNLAFKYLFESILKMFELSIKYNISTENEISHYFKYQTMESSSHQ